jgi:drug/metabolite transporter (DMT)-like permease
MTTNQTESWKGYLYAFGGTVAFSSLYVFSKAGLNRVELAQFGLYYFGIAFLLNLALAIFSGKIREIFSFSRRTILLFLLLAFIDLLSNLTFFLAIRIIPDPSVTSFLGNLFPVFLTFMGIVFLKERFSRIEAIGGILAIIGAFAISYSGELEWRKFFIPGTGMVVVNTLLAATFSVVVKRNVKAASPVVFNLNSNFWIFLFFLGYFLSSGQTAQIPTTALVNISLGAFFGSFLGLLCIYYSYNYMAASRSSIIQSLKGFIVLIMAYFFFGTLPLPVQLWGGAIIITGVVIMMLGQAGMIKPWKKGTSQN